MNDEKDQGQPTEGGEEKTETKVETPEGAKVEETTKTGGTEGEGGGGESSDE